MIEDFGSDELNRFSFLILIYNYSNLSSPSQACGESKKGEQDSVEVEKPLQYAPQVLLQKLLFTLLNQMF